MKLSLRQADAAWKEKTGTLKPGELSCRSGCFGCCIGSFAIALPEALLVRGGLARLDDPARKDVLRRARRIAERTAGVFPGDATAGVLDPERSDADEDAFFDAAGALACPMLELPSGRCRIYEERPVTCRTFGLAWKRGEAQTHPACSLNFVGAPPERPGDTALDLDLLLEGDQRAAIAALEQGLPSGMETTIAHAVLGTAFEDLGF